MTTEQLHDLRQLAQRTFERELPHLWEECPEQFVAYRGDHRLGVSARKHELYQLCTQLGLPDDECVVYCIAPQETEVWIGPLFTD